jgi:hypothetical protein
VFYVGHIDKIIKPFSMLQSQVSSSSYIYHSGGRGGGGMIRIEECIIESRNLTTLLIERSFSNAKKGINNSI